MWDVSATAAVGCRTKSNNLALIDLYRERGGWAQITYVLVSCPYYYFLEISSIFFINPSAERERAATYLCGKLECATHQYSKQSQKLTIWPPFSLLCAMRAKYIFTLFSRHGKDTRVVWALEDICPANIYSSFFTDTHAYIKIQFIFCCCDPIGL